MGVRDGFGKGAPRGDRRDRDRGGRSRAAAVLLAAMASAALAGCGGPIGPQGAVAIPTGPGRYQLQLRPAWYTSPADTAPTYLLRRALSLCPRGFERVGEAVEPRERGGTLVVWDIACR